MGFSITYLDVLLIVASLLIVHKLVSRQKQVAPFPPGPPRWPLLGNVLDMPTQYEWHKFAEWGQKYGQLRGVLYIYDNI